MTAFSAYAPGKCILFGEHAVVYGRPAIAVPVTQVRARAQIEPNLRGPSGDIHIVAHDIDLDSRLTLLPTDHPIQVAIRLTQEMIGVRKPPACTVRINSTIPVASGLGSGAAVAVALIRVLAAFWGHHLTNEQVCSLAFEVEKLHHGTPSGIDNTVVTFELPVYFIRERPIELLRVKEPFTLVIGDTGKPSPTALSVSDVRQAWLADPQRYESYFDEIAVIVNSARQAIEDGSVDRIGSLMDQNHSVLQKMGVSSPALDQLVLAARQAGAWGAKLSGGGRGGNMIALVPTDHADPVRHALQSAGAVRTWISEVH